MTKYQAVGQEFKDALKSLEEVLKKPKDEFIRDSAIKRFELFFDLSWKVIKSWLEEKGSSCTSPLVCFKEGYRHGLLEFEEIWVDLVKTRNKTVHTYSIKVAEEVYEKLSQSLEAFQKLSRALEREK